MFVSHLGKRRATAALVVGLTVFLVSTCGEQAPDTQQFYVEPRPPDNPTAQTDAAAEDLADRESLPNTIPIFPVDGSGTTGELSTTGQGSQILLVVEVAGLPADGEFGTHIHRGVCAEGGPVAALLSSVVTGSDGSGASTTTVGADALPPNEPLFVQIHGPTGAPIACGDLVES